MSLISAHMDVSEELKLLATAFDAHQPIAILDRNGTFIRVNQAFSKLTGYPGHQLKGHNVRMLRSRRHQEQFYRDIWLNLYEKGHWQGELWNQLKEREALHHVNITAVTDEAGHFTHYVAFYEDQSEIYYQQQLLEQKARQENTLSILLALCLEDLPMQAFLSQCRRQLELKNLWSWKQLALYAIDHSGLRTVIEHGDCTDQTCQKIPMTLSLCKQVSEHQIPRELKLRSEQSEICSIEETHTLYAIPLQQSQQSCVLVLSLPSDTLSSPIQKDFVHRVVHILGMGINKRATEQALIEAREKAEQANKAKSQLLASVSHELRTPLNAILGFSQIMLSDELNEEQRENAEEIHSSGQHLLILINDLLDLARMESGRINLQIESIPIHNIIDESVSLIRQLAQTRQLTISIQSNLTDNPDILADKTRLKQVIVNLLSNAVKYNVDQGHIEVTLEQSEPAFLSVSVRDTGIGINPDYHAQMFQVFNRLGAEDSAVEGTGIGLAICKRLMQMMYGQISYQPAQPSGSIFTLDIPVASTTDRTEQHQSRFSILYIDNDPIRQQQIQTMLQQREDIRLFTENNASYALDLALKHSFDLILLDTDMPDLSAEEVLEILKASPRTATVPAVAINGAQDSSAISQSLRAGFNEYLPRPLDMEKLLLIIEQLQQEQHQLLLNTD